MRPWHLVLLAVAWAVYGGTSYVGGVVASSHAQLSPFVILLWMLAGRAVGGVLGTCVGWVSSRRHEDHGLGLGLADLTWAQIAAPSILPTVGNVGWVAYFALSRSQNVSVLMPLLSTYVILPIAYGLARRREACTPTKALGVVLVLATGALLGVEVSSSSSSTDGSASRSAPGLSDAQPVWLVSVLFVTTLLSWGASDTISSSLPKGRQTPGTAPTAPPLTSLVLLNAAGYVCNTAVVAMGLHVAGTQGPPFASEAMAALGTWAAVNAAYPVGWCAYMALCRHHEGVVIVPLFGMYILVPAVGGLVFRGDPASPYTIAGVICGAVASVLLAWKAPKGVDLGVKNHTTGDVP